MMDQNKDDIRQIPKVGKSAQISAFGTLKECLTGKADKGESSGNSTSSAEPFCESADGYTSEASQSDCRISRQASPEQHDEVDLVQKPAAGASLLGAPPGLEEVVGNSPATIPSTSGKVPTCSTADSDAACGMMGGSLTISRVPILGAGPPWVLAAKVHGLRWAHVQPQPELLHVQTRMTAYLHFELLFKS